MSHHRKIQKRHRPFGRPQRRRAAGLRELWRIMVPGTGQMLSVGYLVTTGKLFPDPIAFVPLASRRGLEVAKAIRDDHGKAKRYRCGLTGTTWQKAFKRIYGGVLIPVDSLGRQIALDATYAAAQFYPAYHWHGVEYRRISETELGYLQKKYSGLLSRPTTPTPDSNRGQQSTRTTAAA